MKMIKKILIGVAAVIGVFVLSLVGYMTIIFLGDYGIDEKKLVFPSATKLVDESGNEISKLYREDRELVAISDIPAHVQQAFVAVEDARFYEHSGIDLKAIARAVYKDILARAKVEGGSTITQQLAKNVFLTNDKSLLRKTKELTIALSLENKYTKDQILEMYLNHIYFGHGAYGIQSASKTYFNKDVSELTVDEAAVLAALPKAPNSYSPIKNPDKAKGRRDVVLSLMAKHGYITAEDAVRYQGKTIAVHPKQLQKEPAFATYTDMIIQEAEEKYSLSYDELLEGGYTIVIPLNTKAQKAAYEEFKNPKNFPGKDANAEGSFVLMDSKTGGIQAAIGGRNYENRGLNRVYVKRQPGSTMKPPLVYAPALETGEYTPYSLLRNEQMTFDEYKPHNYDNRYSTDITMYDAIKNSTNIPAVWLLNEVGIKESKTYLEKMDMGIDDNGLSIALGGLSEGYSPLEMAKAYRTFAEGGKMVEPYVINEIRNRHGEIVGEHDKKEVDVYSKQTAWHMTRMLEAVVKEGTAKAGTYNGALAGKTGSTNIPGIKNGMRDAWFVGYTPNLVGAVWMGYDKTDDQHYLVGGSNYPTTVMKNILSEIDADATPAFAKPDDVEELDAPIRLDLLKDVEADLTFTPLGLFTAKITWTPLPDERVEYRVYRVDGEEAKLEGSVTGEGHYEVSFVNAFRPPSFYVVPYNPQTNQEGEKSKVVTP
ncbi:transglycosylase domain-containing protein [Priestia taiwanensis]|nr:PBP1A family penicillin-binding protein [Priestia taiwanensis]